MISVFVPGLPQAQGSTRSFVVKGRAVTTSTNKNIKSWRQDVCSIIGPCTPNPKPARLALVFTFPRPKSHFNSKGVVKEAFSIWKTSKPDLDKLVRAAMDALTIAEVWVDDSQVVELSARKSYMGRPGVSIAIDFKDGEF